MSADTSTIAFNETSTLQKARAAYRPRLPKALLSENIGVELGTHIEPAKDREDLKNLFPQTYGQPLAAIVEGDGRLPATPLRVGVVLSGGQAPGGHNVIAGIFDALKAVNPSSVLLGFLKGPGGIIKGEYKELTREFIDQYRNTGGFDMIMSGRDKIEKPEHLAACKKNFDVLDLDGLVIIGGDDSNTNAAVLAEYLKAAGSKISIIGVPKTIDGDMKNEFIETSFGFDTACKIYSELIGNICRDSASAVKYWHFIRLMGRAASHVALECALQTHPNITLISEEIEADGTILENIVENITDIVIRRAKAGKNYGVLVVPEGVPEFIPDIKIMIDELSEILGRDEEYIHSLTSHEDRVQHVNSQLSDHSAHVYGSPPEQIQEALLRRDAHGNVPLSQVETERLLIDLVSDRIKLMISHGETDVKFDTLSHFFGYEGRCGFPTNFDADYCYTLGYSAVQLIRAKLTGYTVSIQNLTRHADEWIAGGTPIAAMLHMEVRKGRRVPVIRKALIDLDGKPFKEFAAKRDDWALDDDFVFPGPIQYFGPPETCDAPTITLMLERGA